MRAAILILFWAGLVNAFADSTNASSSETRMSKPMPTFTLKNLAGDEISSSNYVGKIRIVLFWASWDGPCQRQLPALNELQRTFATNNVAVLGLALDQKLDDLKVFAATNSIDFPILVADYYTIQGFGGLEAIPTLFIVEPHGVVISRHVGFIDKDVLKRIVQAVIENTR